MENSKLWDNLRDVRQDAQWLIFLEEPFRVDILYGKGENPNQLGAWMQDNYSALYDTETSANLVDRIAALKTG